MLEWLAGSAEASVTRRAIIRDFFVCDAVACVAMLGIQLSGDLHLLAWGDAIYLFFAPGFGYFLLPQRRPAG